MPTVIAAIEAVRNAATIHTALPLLRELAGRRLTSRHADRVAQALDTLPGVMADSEDGLVWIADLNQMAHQVRGPRCADGGYDVAPATTRGLRYVTGGRSPLAAVRWAVRRVESMVETYHDA
jgi:hypothetical protein